MVGSAAFWDKVADKYAKDPIKDMDAYERTLDRAVSYLKADDHVLELACGTSTTALRIAPHVGRLRATDVSRRMVEIGAEKVRAAGAGNIENAQATAESELSDGAKYDAVLAFNYLHLSDDPQAEIGRILQLVKPGGYFISKSACMRGWKRFVIPPVIWVMQKIGKAPHLSYFTTGELDQMMREAGFEVVETHDFSMSPPSHFIVARRP